MSNDKVPQNEGKDAGDEGDELEDDDGFVSASLGKGLKDAFPDKKQRLYVQRLLVRSCFLSDLFCLGRAGLRGGVGGWAVRSLYQQ